MPDAQSGAQALASFDFEGLGIRVQLDAGGAPWFSANDVCSALEFVNPHKAVADHVDADDLTKREVIDSMGRSQRANFTFDSVWIKEMSEVLGKDVACEHYLYECYCPSGEFKPETLNVPEHCTLESLGVDEYHAKVDDLKQLLAFTYGEA